MSIEFYQQWIRKIQKFSNWYIDGIDDREKINIWCFFIRMIIYSYEEIQ